MTAPAQVSGPGPYSRRTDALLERFESKYVPEPNSGCWLWTGAPNEKGYGRFAFSKLDVHKAHRASWILHIGPLAEDDCVLHHCDTPACVNPNHLFLGDRAVNNRDMCRKGRSHQQKKTHCPQGHVYSVANTYTYKGRRNCRRCNSKVGRRERALCRP